MCSFILIHPTNLYDGHIICTLLWRGFVLCELQVMFSGKMSTWGYVHPRVRSIFSFPELDAILLQLARNVNKDEERGAVQAFGRMGRFTQQNDAKWGCIWENTMVYWMYMSIVYCFNSLYFICFFFCNVMLSVSQLYPLMTTQCGPSYCQLKFQRVPGCVHQRYCGKKSWPL